MNDHRIVSMDEWRVARERLLLKEKELTRARDQLSEERRALPWVRVDKSYVFQGPEGQVTLTDLFEGRSQLIVYHFMFAPDWERGCKSCSFWADNFNGIIPHLKQRDVSFAAVSRAPLAKLRAFEQRMGWGFRWVSSEGSDFNFDLGVSFRAEDLAAGKATYNYAPYNQSTTDKQGISTFYREPSGALFHTYSTYGRGVDAMNSAYQYLDLVPKGRDEGGLSFPMAWVKLRDEYT